MTPLARASPLAVRVAMAWVFLTSGVLKFLYANQGPGRFAKLGFPAPAALASFVGVVEIAGGLLLAVGLFTRLAAIPLVIDMAVAIASSKLPFLWGGAAEPIAAPPQTGFWAFAYQARLDLTMLACALFLVAAGAGSWSLDAWRARRREAAAHPDLRDPGLVPH